MQFIAQLNYSFTRSLRWGACFEAVWLLIFSK